MKHRAKGIVYTSFIAVAIAAVFPLTAYAANTPNATVTATITPSISIDAVSGFSQTGDAGTVINGSVSATVTSNTKYTIGIKVKEGSESTAMVSAAGESIPAGTSVAAGTNAWGIKKKTGPGDNDNVDAYTAVTMANETFFTSTGRSNGSAPVKFAVGISTASDIAAGSYSVDLTLTAAAAP